MEECDEDFTEDDEFCAAAPEVRQQANRLGNNNRNRPDRGGQQQRGGQARGRFRNEGRCFICNKLGQFRAECFMLKEAVKIKAEKDGKGASSISCDLCDGPHQFSQCPEDSRCKEELKQAFVKKDPNEDSTKDHRTDMANRLPMTSRIMAVLEEGPVEGEG